jgi:hypothetical protein
VDKRQRELKRHHEELARQQQETLARLEADYQAAVARYDQAWTDLVTARERRNELDPVVQTVERHEAGREVEARAEALAAAKGERDEAKNRWTRYRQWCDSLAAQHQRGVIVNADGTQSLAWEV